jgi:hypothetical protein
MRTCARVRPGGRRPAHGRDRRIAVLHCGQGAVRCSHQAAGVCSQRFVLLNATQALGGAIALAGIALVFTALFLALR